MRIFSLEELVELGADKISGDRLTLEGLMYVRSTSFSQKLKAAAEKIYREYQAQKVKCLLIKDKDDIMLTLWVSQSQKVANNQKSVSTITPPVTTDKDNSASNSVKQSSPLPTDEKTMTYRGKNYAVNASEENPPDTPEQKKPETPKRMYRGRAY